MLIEIQQWKCLGCGHSFRHLFGGIVLKDSPACPRCGSNLTKRINEGFPFK